MARSPFLLALICVLTVLQSNIAQAESATALIPLPDTEVTKLGPYKAWLIDPTTRYDHGALGDAVEAGGFVVQQGKKHLVYRLPQDAVFEDRRVRLFDLDKDGVPEAIIVKSYLKRGAAIAVYRLGADAIEPLTESEAIGTRNRWLNPVGIADFTGTGKLAIAAVITPHLTGSLRLYELNNGALTEIARIDGYTNHIAGNTDLDLARVVGFGEDTPPQIIIPTLDRQTLVAVSFAGGVPRIVKNWPLNARIETLKIDANLQAKITTSSGKQIINLRNEQ